MSNRLREDAQTLGAIGSISVAMLATNITIPVYLGLFGQETASTCPSCSCHLLRGLEQEAEMLDECERLTSKFKVVEA